VLERNKTDTLQEQQADGGGGRKSGGKEALGKAMGGFLQDAIGTGEGVPEAAGPKKRELALL